MIILSLMAGLLQFMGYAIYIKLSLKKELEPNGATWLMFAYGVSLLTIIEWDSGADSHLLILPVVCATLAVVVALICWKKGTLKWPDDWEDRFAFVCDLLLTLVYLITALLVFKDLLSPESSELALWIFLIVSNATAFTSFAPLIRGAWKKPELEKALPWVVWTVAYVCLGISTYYTEGLLTSLMIYPVVNAFLHGLVAVLASRK